MTKDQKNVLRERIRKLDNDIRWRGDSLLEYLDEIEKMKTEKALLEALVQDPKEAIA